MRIGFVTAILLLPILGGAPAIRADDHVAAARVLDDSKRIVELQWPARAGLDAAATLELCEALQRVGRSSDAHDVLTRAVARLPSAAPLRLAWVDQALADGQPATALKRIDESPDEMRAAPRMRLRAARAYAALNQIVGDAQVRTIENGRVGQFAGEWFVLEKRDGIDRFWCCPEKSALYQLRRAFDDGLDEPAAHLLYMDLWRRAGRPKTALAILAAREQVLVAAADDAGLAQIADLVLDVGQIADFLRYSRLRAESASKSDAAAVATSRPAAARKSEILVSAYLRAAEKYAEQGDPPMHASMLCRALELRPDDAKLLIRAADAEWDAEQRTTAAAHYQRALELDRGLAGSERILERLASVHAEKTP